RRHGCGVLERQNVGAVPAAARPMGRLQQRTARLSSGGADGRMAGRRLPSSQPFGRVHMNLIPPKIEYTPEDLLTMPDGERFELVDGRLVELHMGFLAGWISGRLFSRLSAFCDAHPIGWMFPGGDAGYRGFPDSSKTVRKPDVSFVS